MSEVKSRAAPSARNGQKIKQDPNATLAKLFLPQLARFQALAKRDLAFHTSFIALGVASLIGFIFFFSFLADSFLMGLFVAFIFFALVLYFVLKLYFQEQKPAELVSICNQYKSHLTEILGKDNPKAHAEALSNIASKLDNAEVSFYRLPSWLEGARPYFEGMWRTLHWNDVHLFKELFLRAALEQKIELVKSAPLDPEAHMDLAESYLQLAMHAKAPIMAKTLTWKSSSKMQALQNAFHANMATAIEEYAIVKDLTPNNLSVHKRLADGYNVLNMPEKEIEEYQRIVEIAPDDLQALHSLGKLYFRLGQNSKGLKVYEKLEELSPNDARALLDRYGI